MNNKNQSFNFAWQDVIPVVQTRGLWFFVGVLALIILLALGQAWADYANLSSWMKPLQWAIWVLALFWLLVFLSELLALYWVRFFSPIMDIQIKRTLNNNLSVHEETCVHLHLTCQSLPTWLNLLVMDEVMDNAKVHDLPASVSAQQFLPAQSVMISYTTTPLMRGLGVFGGVHLALVGRFGLLALYGRVDARHIEGQDSVRVFANFRQADFGSLAMLAQHSAIEGKMHKKQRGQGQDFHQVRRYSQGDSMRHIDWRATSRLAHLMTREFCDEKDQALLFLLDTSSRMRHTQLDGTSLANQSHLDTALNAMLTLASIAIHQGDSVGFISFSGVNDKLVPSKKGASVMSYLLNQSFDIQASMKMPDYLAAAKSALSLQRKRSLVVLLTSTRSESFDELIDAIHLLRAKHLVIVANLYEEALAERMQTLPHTFDDARNYHAMREHLNLQIMLKQALQNMAHVHAIHCTSSQLPKALVASYLAVKQKQVY